MSEDCQLRPSNEGKVCDAAVSSIEQRTGAARKDIRRPEKDLIGPPVELLLEIGAQEYAIEHTQIEAFEGEIGRGVWLERLVGPVEKALSGKLPGPACYTMFFPFDRDLGVNKSNPEQHQENLKEWVRENAPLLYGKVQERIGGKSVSEVPKKHFKEFHQSKALRLPIRNRIVLPDLLASFRAGTRLLGAGRCVPDLEALFVCRMRRALRKKLPKLRCCKSEGARTVLVFGE